MIAFRRKFFNFASKSHKRMDYNNYSHIETIKDVTLFFDYLVNDRKVNFNPDNDFEDYVCTETYEPLFLSEECKLFNRLMQECFDVCEQADSADLVYDIGNGILWEWIRKNVA